MFKGLDICLENMLPEVYPDDFKSDLSGLCGTFQSWLL